MPASTGRRSAPRGSCGRGSESWRDTRPCGRAIAASLPHIDLLTYPSKCLRRTSAALRAGGVFRSRVRARPRRGRWRTSGTLSGLRRGRRERRERDPQSSRSVVAITPMIDRAERRTHRATSEARTAGPMASIVPLPPRGAGPGYGTPAPTAQEQIVDSVLGVSARPTDDPTRAAAVVGSRHASQTLAEANPVLRSEQLVATIRGSSCLRIEEHELMGDGTGARAPTRA